MANEIIDRLLSALSVKLADFAICGIDTSSRLVLEPGSSVILHYVLRGEGTFRTQAGVDLPFVEHSLIIVPTGQSQSIGASHTRRAEKFRPERCRTLPDGLQSYRAGNGGDIVFVCGSVRANYAGNMELFDGLSAPIVINTTAADPLRHFYEMFITEMSMSVVGMRAATEALMKLCLVALVRQQASATVESSFFLGLQDRKLANAVAEMMERPATQHTVESLACAAGMCRSAFAEQFRLVFQTSPMDFLHGVRLRRAEDLLKTTDLSVKQITRTIGLRSRSHFSRTFRAQYEIDPTGFRAVARRDFAQSQKVSPREMSPGQ